jgi:hypothetical protein
MDREGGSLMIHAFDAWALRRLLIGEALNGGLEAVSEPLRRGAVHLAARPPEARPEAFQAFLCGLPREASDALVKRMAEVDPMQPPPEAGLTARCATLADLRRLVAEARWVWPGWLAAGVLNALAADPGTGKTVMAMDLARRLWTGDLMPDGQTNPMPEGATTLWVPGDRHHAQLIDLAGSYGLPDEAVKINATPEEPTGGLDLDDPAELAALADRIRAERPGVVIVDTVGMTSGRNLCRPEDAREYFGPLMALAGETGTAFLLLTHLSKDGQALGRRISGACRLVWKMTCPDPEGQPDRRRVAVEKTYTMRPPALGMTIADAGCSFDSNPPTTPEPAPIRRGPSPAKLEACKAWLKDRLTPNPARVSEVRKDAEAAGHSADRLYAARDALGVEEYEVEGRKWWKLPGATDPEEPDRGSPL